MTPPQKKPHYTLQNVRIFDGNQICSPSTIHISNGYIVTSPNPNNTIDETQMIDCNNDVLLPGFIDAHIHLSSPKPLSQLSSHGITTALDMGSYPPTLITNLKTSPSAKQGGGGQTSILTSGLIATAPGSNHSHLFNLPDKALITTTQQAVEFVAERIAENADFIKIIVDVPGLSQEILDTIVTTSRGYGKLTIAHATNNATFSMAEKASVDIITHVPLEAALSSKTISLMKTAKITAVPTLTMMQGIASKIGPNNPIIDYKNASDSVTAMHAANLTILVGTDSNSLEEGMGIPYSPPWGESFHREMELLVEAGMSSVQVLRAATVDAARVFGLGDRGGVEGGRRADLVLLGGDPVRDIRETRNLRRVWCGGVEVEVVREVGSSS